MKRRHVLLQGTVAVSLTAGCLSSSGKTDETTTEPPETTAEPTIETLAQRPPDGGVDCSDEAMEPIDFLARESYPEEAEGFELTSSSDTISMGDEITFSLRNVGTERSSIGTIYKYTFQRLENDEWQSIYYTPNSGWIDRVEAIRPGGGYDWPFTFNQNGLERANPGNADHYVCASLEPGTYRFVYWGIGEEAIATKFTVEST